MEKRRIRNVLAGIAMALNLVACTAEDYRGQLVEELKSPQLTGQNWDGKTFKISDVSGKVTLVFFGYTSCPDICPFTLLKMKQLYGSLGDAAEQVAVIYASVDPHRDSVEKMAGYVPNFDRRFYGLRLAGPDLERAMDSFGLTVQYGQPKDGPGTDSYYYVDHTGTLFLLDREGRLRVKFPPNVKVIDLETDIRTLLAG